MQIETMMKYQLISVRMVIIKRQEITSVSEDVEKGTLVHHWWECKLMEPLWEMVWSFLKKVLENTQF